jgi:hypothetical protein
MPIPCHCKHLYLSHVPMCITFVGRPQPDEIGKRQVPGSCVEEVERVKRKLGKRDKEKIYFEVEKSAYSKI